MCLALSAPRRIRLRSPGATRHRRSAGGKAMLKKCAVMAALVLALSPAAAHADWLFTPNLGATFGGSTPTEHFTYGASIGWMGNGIFGWEADLSYTPDFFEPSGGGLEFVDSNNVVSVMGNAIIGIPIG